ncbi:hypothetical protein [Dactylosporangium sp. CA-233914]|uniref:hypothetical protein n=1 Tax=Dactylosporangium sp. CA-233914 TaxID=3239934 RepID=UPI003D8B432A
MTDTPGAAGPVVLVAGLPVVAAGRGVRVVAVLFGLVALADAVEDSKAGPDGAGLPVTDGRAATDVLPAVFLQAPAASSTTPATIAAVRDAPITVAPDLFDTRAS